MQTSELCLLLCLPAVIVSVSSKGAGDKERTAKLVKPDGLIFEGDLVSLHCKVDGDPAGWIYQLYKSTDTYLYEARTDSTFTISPVTLSHNGEYRCRAVKGELYSKMSETVQLAVSELFSKPTLTVLPGNTVWEGDTVTVRCQSTSGVQSPQLTYRFYSGETSVSHQTRNDFTIQTARQSHTGSYWCEVEAEGKRIDKKKSDITQVTVNEIPKATLNLKNKWKRLYIGDTMTLECSIEGYYTGWKYQWYKGSNIYQRFLIEGFTGPTYTVQSVTQPGIKGYFCYATRDGSPRYSKHSNDIKVTIYERTTKLEVKSKNTHGEVYESEQVSLHCGVDGDPVGWIYELYKTGDRNPYKTQMEHIFTISSVNISHSGEYWCRAGKEKLYSKASDPVQLQVSVDYTTENSLRLGASGLVMIVLLIIISESFWTRVSSASGSSSLLSLEGRLVLAALVGNLYGCVRLAIFIGSPAVGLEAARFNVKMPAHIVGSLLSLEGRLVLAALVGNLYGCVRLAIFIGSPAVGLEAARLIVKMPAHIVASNLFAPNVCSFLFEDKCKMQTSKLCLLLWLPAVIVSASSQDAEDTENPKSTLKLKNEWNSLYIGDTMTLECSIEGYYTGWKYQWYKRSNINQQFLIEGFTGPTYTVQSVTQPDSSTYWCSATRDGSPRYSKDSNDIKVTIYENPKATLKLKNDWNSLYVGDTMTLVCSIEGYYTGWKYQWYKGSNIYQRFLIEGFTGPTYTVQSVTEPDSNTYWCSATRDGFPRYSKDSNDIKVTIYERTTKLEVKSKNINGEVYESEQVSLHCGVDGDHDGWTYELYKTGDRNPYTTQMENIFTISSVNITHSGEYWCRAGKEKLYSKASDPVQLQVSALNVTLSASPRRYVKVKDFLNLNCTWGGNQSSVSTLKFSFLRNNVTVKNSSDSTLFSIKQFNASQTGKYKCAVETPGGGKAYSNEIEIVMKESPLAIILASVGFGLFILVVLLLFVYHRTRGFPSFGGIKCRREEKGKDAITSSGGAMQIDPLSKEGDSAAASNDVVYSELVQEKIMKKRGKISAETTNVTYSDVKLKNATGAPFSTASDHLYASVLPRKGKK
ncbi:uncharacterized protein LOC120519065 [Polypterus senegalus]|uniref:uncharacterized protein LOC120519065 n=1 Tax=Polypterus senegalus TaxID=55291 RepID=UPI0019630AF5|nr:uncharacterized protein LOC120519065 [Polypterus senegalus]